MGDLCRLVIDNHNCIKSVDESRLEADSELPGLCSAVETLGGSDRVLQFGKSDGFWERLVHHASRLEELFPADNSSNRGELEIPLLSRAKGASMVQLSSQQISCLLCHAFLGNLSRIPLPTKTEPGVSHFLASGQTVPHYGSLSWHLVWGSDRITATERGKALLLYLQKALEEVTEDRMIAFERVVLHDSFSLSERLAAAPNEIAKISFFRGGVELAPGTQTLVDFANEDLHVGAVWPCATQEEIMFSIHPECFAGLLFCETMDEGEAIRISNVRPYCQTTGFQDSFRVQGSIDQQDSFACTPKTILAMDSSIAFLTENTMSNQCKGPDRDRDILKAVTAFPDEAVIATGHWGCGAFGGNVYCKFLVQLIAASLRKDVELIYCLVGGDSEALEQEFRAILQGILDKGWGPDDVYNAMSAFKGRESPEDMKKFVLETFSGR